jgi:hypothetical protein
MKVQEVYILHVFYSTWFYNYKYFYFISGLQLCFGQPVDNQILNLLRSEVDELREAVQTWSLDSEQVWEFVHFT